MLTVYAQNQLLKPLAQYYMKFGLFLFFHCVYSFGLYKEFGGIQSSTISPKE